MDFRNFQGGDLMHQAKFSLKESNILFLQECRSYGFKDKSEAVRTALDRLAEDLTRQRLRESAALYEEVYEEDRETREWMDADLAEWPS
jgi:Arc/MetJ-type ribon-helix-helix transcriptional regulator